MMYAFEVVIHGLVITIFSTNYFTYHNKSFNPNFIKNIIEKVQST